MIFEEGIVWARLDGNLAERKAIRKILSFKDGCFLKSNGMIYAGLVDFLERKLEGRFPIQRIKTYALPSTPIRRIEIPDDYIPLDNPEDRLRFYQIVAARKIISKGRGVLEIATGGGKTEIFAVILKYLFENEMADKAYVICETRFLARQFALRMQKRGIEDVNLFAGKKTFKTARVQVCVVDSLLLALRSGREEVIEDFGKCDIFGADETHHLQAKSWILIAELCPAPYRIGLTATVWSDPTKYSHSDFYLLGLIGDIVVNIPSIVLRRRGLLAEPVVTMLPVNEPRFRARSWDKIYASGIVRHSRRNSKIVSIGQCLYHAGYKTLCFVSQINHGLLLVKTLTELGCKNVCFVKGGEKMYTWRPSGRWEVRKTDIETLSEAVRDDEKVLVVGNVVLDEGVDIPSFNALIMGTAMKKYRRSIQRIGRGMRPKKDDNRVFVFDFLDATHSTLLSHSEYRLQTYEMEAYTFAESIEHIEEMMGIEITLEEDLCRWEETRPKKSRRSRRSD